MRLLRRCLRDYRVLWKTWLPLMLLAILAPLVGLLGPLVEKRLIDNVVLARRLDLLAGTIALFVGLWAAGTVMWALANVLRSYLAEKFGLLLRQRLFAHTGALSLAFARREHSGRTMSLFVNDVPALTDLFSTTVLGGIGNLVALAVGTVLMVTLNRELGIAAILGPAVIALAASIITRPLRAAARRVQEKASEVVQHIQEHLAGIREVAAFGQTSVQESNFRGTLNELLRLRMRLTFMDTGIQSGAGVVSLVISLSILAYGAYLVIQGKTSLGTVIAIRSLFGLLYQPAGQIIGMFSNTQKALGAADRIYAFLDQRPVVNECVEPLTIADVHGRIEFASVGFAYRPGHPVVRNVSILAEPGTMVALVGSSGAGKSTLMSLLARFYDPTEGKVLFDDVDLRNLSLPWLREQIGIVFQDTFLFASTVRENIALGRTSADDAQIMAAAQLANAWEFIEELPQGLDTPVGERGVHLSEGQKQRIAIARALVREPRVLILDEPTSALDAKSDHLLQAALDNAARGRTTFVIAHRLATVRRADQILVLEGGCIVERGTHVELLQRQGAYRELCDLQFGRTGMYEDPDLVRGTV